MTGERKSDEKVKNAGCNRRDKAMGTGESGGEKKKPDGFRPIAGLGVRRER